MCLGLLAGYAWARRSEVDASSTNELCASQLAQLNSVAHLARCIALLHTNLAVLRRYARRRGRRAKTSNQTLHTAKATMSNFGGNAGQDWETVNVGRSTKPFKKPTQGDKKQSLTSAQRSGAAVSQARQFATANKSVGGHGPMGTSAGAGAGRAPRVDGRRARAGRRLVSPLRTTVSQDCAPHRRAFRRCGAPAFKTTRSSGPSELARSSAVVEGGALVSVGRPALAGSV